MWDSVRRCVDAFHPHRETGIVVKENVSMRTLGLVLILLPLPLTFAPAQNSKPALKVEKDGFPGGHATPEGAACDLARAFIRRDAALFKSTCIKPFDGGENRKKYEAFLTQTAQQINKEAAKTTPSPNGPKTIGKVFAARHLSRNGPASYGYAVFGFKDVEFVDVGVFLHNDRRALNRTLVIQEADGKWYVDPLPSASPLLSEGLNDEAASTQDFTEVYTIKK
jgi:hypothetical protein